MKTAMSEFTFDIETIPAQGGAYNEFLLAEQQNFKAPSSLSKKQACADMGVDPDNGHWKYITKDDCIKAWEEQFAAIKAPDVAMEKWKKTGLDGTRGEIVAISYMVEPGIAIGAYRKLGNSEGDLLQNFYDEVACIMNGRTSPLLVGHNIGNFDIKFLFQRSVILGVKPSIKLPVGGSHGRDYFDNMVAWTGYRKEYISQDALAKALGLPGKPDHIDGSQVWDYVQQGKEAMVADYCNDDVSQTWKIYKRLNFFPGSSRLTSGEVAA